MKKTYELFCAQTFVPIFSQPWWMDIVCGTNNWDVRIVENNNNIIAAMPYYLLEEGQNRIITKPKLTQNNGIIIKYPPKQGYQKKLDYEEKIIDELSNYIESLNITKYEQQFHYYFDNWLPFFWKYYKETTKYTYVIDDTSDMDMVVSNYTSNARNMLRKAQRMVNVIETDDVDKFYKINELTFARQGKSVPFSSELLKELFLETKIRNCGKLIFAIDSKKQIHSGAFIVWDEQSVYYLVNGTDPKYKDSQANTLLIHHSIQLASEMGKKFDFEGSVIKAVEKAFRQFGGIRKPYFRISKEFISDSVKYL